MRGKLTLWLRTPLRTRLIPAGAGKTSASIKCTLDTTAHPRRCGENLPGLSGCFIAFGSSPQVRGKLLLLNPDDVADRLIPAGAGKTQGDVLDWLAAAAHPRRCGENHSVKRRVARWDGSSPQVRGKLGKKSPEVVALRLIPAGAGKTPP